MFYRARQVRLGKMVFRYLSIIFFKNIYKIIISTNYFTYTFICFGAHYHFILRYSGDDHIIMLVNTIVFFFFLARKIIASNTPYTVLRPTHDDHVPINLHSFQLVLLLFFTYFFILTRFIFFIFFLGFGIFYFVFAFV